MVKEGEIPSNSASSFDTSRFNNIPFREQPEQNSRPSSNVKRNPIINKQRFLSPLSETFLNDIFREARREQKRFPTPGPRKDKRIMG